MRSSYDHRLSPILNYQEPRLFNNAARGILDRFIYDDSLPFERKRGLTENHQDYDEINFSDPNLIGENRESEANKPFELNREQKSEDASFVFEVESQSAVTDFNFQR